MIRYALPVAALALSACTTSLETRPAYERTAAHSALPGVEYSLPMLQYQVELSYKVDACPAADEDKPASLVVKASAASGYVAGESYTIDYAALSSPMKTSDFSIQTREGTNILQSINASAEDKTADVVKSAVELGLDLVGLVAPVPKVALPQGVQPEGIRAGTELLAQFSRQRLACSEDTLGVMRELAAAKKEVDDLKPKLERGTKEIEQITARAKLRLTGLSDRRRLYRLQLEQLKFGEQLAGAQERMTKAEKALAFTVSDAWPHSPFQFSGDVPISPQFAVWARKRFVLAPSQLVDVDGLRTALDLRLAARDLGQRDTDLLRRLVEGIIERHRGLSTEGFCDIGQDLVECARRQVAVAARLERPGAEPSPCDGSVPADFHTACVTSAGAVPARTNVPHKGIFIRPPGRARLVLCRKVKGCDVEDDPLHRSGWDKAPQMGQLRFIPMRNRMFQNNALVLTLREDGSIEKLQYSDKAAVAAVALAAAADTANKVETFLDEREKERKQAITDARAEVTYQRQEVAYQRAEIAYQRTEAAAVRAEEIAKLQHEIDKLTKQKARLAAEAPAVVPQSFLNETTWIEAQVAQLRSRLALLKAEEEYAKEQAASGGS